MEKIHKFLTNGEIDSNTAQFSPAIRGSRSASSALAAAHETLGNR